ncbi:MAG: serine acetyltransferase [Deltaproteobacteria bacterium]|jgi:serine O-acetyltransferase|nr:serine acetyltransferase [Deltaproteobacteria bacterium]
MAAASNDKSCEYVLAELNYLTEDAPVLEETSERLAGMRSDYRAFEYVTSVPRPSFAAVDEIIKLTRQLVFPGFFEPLQPSTDLTVKFSIGQLVNRLFCVLTKEICAAIRHDHIRYNRSCTDCHQQARAAAMALIKELPKLRELTASDVLAAKEGDPAADNHLDQIILCYPGVYATLVHRLAHELWGLDVPFLPRIMTEHAHSQTGIDIHPGASIGSSFFIDHGTGVVVGETTVIGRRVRLYQGVTLGALSLSRAEVEALRGRKRHPTIEDDVIVYAGATILGGETVIGARSVVGGNVWLTESIPSDTKVFIKKPELIIVNSTEGGRPGRA